MTTPSYGQPEPFEPVAPESRVARPAARPKRNFVPIVAGVILAVVAFAGGFAVANATATKTTAGIGANGGDFGGGAFPNASGRPRNNGGFGGGGGGASGTVGSVSADQMTITTAAGGSRIVLLTPTTTVTEVTSATKTVSDIASGKTVTVVGTSNPDGSVTATRVILGDAGIFGRGPGGRPDGSPAPSTK
jgi:hypothetical protein